MEQAMQIEDPYRRRDVLQRLFCYWIGSDPEVALQAIRDIDSVVLQRGLYRDALKWLAGDDPQAAIKLLEARKNLHDHDLWGRSLASGARTDREAATTAALGMEHSGMRSQVLRSRRPSSRQMPGRRRRSWT